MMNNKSAYCGGALTLLLCLIASQANAQTKQIIKAAATTPAKAAGAIAPKIAPLPTLKNLSYIRATPIDLENASGLRLAPQGAKHSIVPSELTILGSEKVFRRGKLDAPKIDVSVSILTPAERQRWRELREKFNSLAYGDPTPVGALGRYLRHSVPPETYQHIQTQYTDLVEKIQVAKTKVSAPIVYASLPGEGKTFTPEEIGKYSEIIYPIVTQIRNLRTALPEEPFLKKQQEAWEMAFSTFNPLLGSLVVSPSRAAYRTDNRVLNTREFDLYNPDGTDYLLPRSETLLVDPDELEEMDSYAAVREKMRNPPIKPEDAAAERVVLLDQIPTGMRIALINDDMLPRVNFKNWADKGYLGHDATIDTFANGDQFMQNVRHGVHYDLVITDLLVPNGGIAMMPQLRALDTKSIVIASSKFDRGEEDHDKLFNLGFDGYLWYNTNLNEGSYGYIEYLRAMKNYFHYKAKYNWER